MGSDDVVFTVVACGVEEPTKYAFAELAQERADALASGGYPASVYINVQVRRCVYVNKPVERED